MTKFNPGDKVLVNNGLVATVVVYDETVDQLVYETSLPGGSSNTTYGHISNTQIELVEAAGAVPHEAQHEAPPQEELPLDGKSE